MSDLQCPVRLLLVCAPPGGAPRWERFEDARVLAVYAEPGLQAHGARAARALGLTPHLLDEGSGTGSLWHAVTDLADLHRGETVLVVLAEDRLVEVLTRLGAPAPPAGEPVRIDVDGDGPRWASGP